MLPCLDQIVDADLEIRPALGDANHSGRLRANAIETSVVT